MCGTCSIETTLPENPRTSICLCKICSEYRDVSCGRIKYLYSMSYKMRFLFHKFLKKSGAWFNKRLPSTDPFLKQNCLSNCSPLKHVTDDRTMFIKNIEESELNEDDTKHLEEDSGNSISDSFKRFTDDSDDEELRKDHTEHVLNVAENLVKSNKEIEKKTIQSNSSTNISNCLKEGNSF